MSSNEQTNLSDVVLEKELLKMWRRLLQNDTVTIDDDFFECGGDSVLAVELLLEIEQLTGKSLARSIIFETGTVRQLVQRIIEADKDKPQESVPVLLGSEQGKIIHFFHGDFGHGGIAVKTFSKILGADYLIHAIPPHLLHSRTLPNSIEDMAKERLPIVLEKQPHGPYVLLGQCNGAVVAFEMARILDSMGKEVKAVVMIDPVIMSVRRSAQLILGAADFIMRLRGIQENKRRERLLRIFTKLFRMDIKTKDFWRRPVYFLLKKRPPKPPKRPWDKDKSHRLEKQRPAWKKFETIRDHYTNALFDYRPLPLNVPVLYLALRFSGGAWRRITKDTVFINMFRGRHTPWSESYGPQLVNKIREFIDS